MIPNVSIVYQDKAGRPLPSASDEAWKYTVVNGKVRTVKGGTPEHLVDGKWVPLA
jgi:hypothetical protein